LEGRGGRVGLIVDTQVLSQTPQTRPGDAVLSDAVLSDPVLSVAVIVLSDAVHPPFLQLSSRTKDSISSMCSSK
jgi:hypothetical protein